LTSDQRRRLEDQADLIPESWRDATFDDDNKHDPHRMGKKRVPPAYRERRIVPHSTRQDAQKRLPVYRIPQRQYMNHFQHLGSRDAQGRLYIPVRATLPDGETPDEAFAFFHHDDTRCVTNQREFYVVLPTAKHEFPTTAPTVHINNKPFRVLQADCPDNRAVGLLVVCPFS